MSWQTKYLIKFYELTFIICISQLEVIIIIAQVELFSAARTTTYERSSDGVVIFDVIKINQGHIFNSRVFSPKSNGLYLVHVAAGVSKYLYKLNITVTNSTQNNYYQIVSNSPLFNSTVSCNCIIPITREDSISVLSKSSLFSNIYEQTSFASLPLNNIMSDEVYMHAGFSGDFKQYNVTQNKLQASLNEAKRHLIIRVPYDALYVMIANIRYKSIEREHKL